MNKIKIEIDLEGEPGQGDTKLIVEKWQEATGEKSAKISIFKNFRWVDVIISEESLKTIVRLLDN